MRTAVDSLFKKAEDELLVYGSEEITPLISAHKINSVISITSV